MHRLDPKALGEARAYLDELVRAKRLPPGEPREYDAAYYHHQLPGGMVTTTTRMLDEIGRPELYPAVLEEVVRVRSNGHPFWSRPSRSS
jgi:oxaloacetate decarboxylase alpha subunit